MHQHEAIQPDYGTGKKKLGIYVVGFIICSILTLIAFLVVIDNVAASRSFVRGDAFHKGQILIIIYSAAIIQFLVQLICFLRLNIQTEQGKNNVMSLIFTGVILVAIIVGSLWIMWNVNHNMMYM